VKEENGEVVTPVPTPVAVVLILPNMQEATPARVQCEVAYCKQSKGLVATRLGTLQPQLNRLMCGAKWRN
jgi:hypothetical protein